jgi:uncharacterized 2Fe-2S/4Fe-4S cluster protein (DUF4445 family)
MIKIKIITRKNVRLIESEGGSTLLDVLRQNGYDIYAPCGGKGTCGKCTVKIKGEGDVIACKYVPDKDTEVYLPEEREAKILVHQTDYLEDLPLNTGNFLAGSTFTYGVAIDAGTTTLVFYFLNLFTGQIEKISSVLNPQRRYGADIITRINHCQEHENGLSELQSSIVDVINREFLVFRKKRNIDPSGIGRVVIAGNTTMLHILLGQDPVSIAIAPFRPKFTAKQILKGSSTGLNINDKGEIITLPCLAAFVGADIVAGLAALKPLYRTFLLIDIGTNGEIALSVDGRILACATAAGPAFEGANISYGMAAVYGALSGFNGPGDYQVIGGCDPAGICGSGIVDIVAYLLRSGLIDETGLLKEPFFVSPDKKIVVTQQDIREIQLAKSAIYSGIKILMNLAGLSFEKIDALYLAGGFGNYIKVSSAIEIGLLPYEMQDRIFPVGNSAGIGALQYLKSVEFEGRINQSLENSEYIELSDIDEFTTEFALNMNFVKINL